VNSSYADRNPSSAWFPWLIAKATARAKDSGEIAIWVVLLRTASARSGSEMLFNSSVATAPGEITVVRI
jgi:hypothetical protein